jgi:hypothetical protein
MYDILKIMTNDKFKQRQNLIHHVYFVNLNLIIKFQVNRKCRTWDNERNHWPCTNTIEPVLNSVHNEWSMGVPKKGSSRHFVLHLISNMAAKMQEFQRMIYEWYFFEDCCTHCWGIFRVIVIWTHSFKTEKVTYKSKHWINIKIKYMSWFSECRTCFQFLNK